MSFRATASFGLAVLALACFCTGLVAAQAPEQPAIESAPAPPPPASATAPSTPTQPQSEAPTITFRQTVRRVILDVMVRDAAGKPVHGLTAKDFSVFENKEPQRVLSFDVYNFDQPSISRGPNAPPLPPNVFVNVPPVPERGPLYVILYDLVNIEMEDQMRARPAVLKFIKSKPEGTRFAIFVNSDEVYLAQGFTADKDLLYACLDSKHSRPHVPRIFLNSRNYGMGNPYTVMDVMTHIGKYLDGIPGRKNLIWVAGTFPAAIFPREGDPADAEQDIRAEMNALAQAQVALFPVNVRGVVVNPEGALTGAMPHGGIGGESVSPPPGQAAPSSAASPLTAAMRVEGKGSSLNTDYATEGEMASMTGGRAFFSDNDTTALLEQATEDGGNYYTLTYSPSNHPDDGKCRGIAVEVAGGKYQLSYRRSYCRAPLVSTADERTPASGPSTLTVPLQAGDVLQANMKLGAPMVHDLIFSAHVRAAGSPALATAAQMQQLQAQAEFFRTHRRNKPDKPLPPTKIQSYTIDYRVLDPEFKMLARNGRQPSLEFAVAAFDSNGKVLNGTVNDAVPDESEEPGENKKSLFRVHQTLAVPAGAVSIRVGVRDRNSDRLGTLEVPLPLKPEPVRQASAAAH